MNEKPSTPAPTTWRTRLLRGAVFTAVLAAGVVAGQFVPGHAAFAAGDIAGMHGPGAGDMRERHRAMMQEHVQRALTDVGASDAQRKKIDGILQAAMEDQHADMERMHADMKLLKELLVAPTIDTARIAIVRAEQEQIALQTTRRLTDVAIAVARELTPQQRQKLGAQIDAMFARHHGPHGDGPRFDGPGGERPRGD